LQKRRSHIAYIGGRAAARPFLRSVTG
jgi:hypothetical protein